MVDANFIEDLLQRIGAAADDLQALAEREQNEVATLDAHVTAEIAKARQKVLHDLTELQRELVSKTGATDQKPLSEILQDEGLESLLPLRFDVFSRLKSAMESSRQNRITIQGAQQAVRSLLEDTGLASQDTMTYGRLGGAGRGGRA